MVENYIKNISQTNRKRTISIDINVYKIQYIL